MKSAAIEESKLPLTMLLFVVMTTVSLVTTTNQSRLLIELGRGFAAIFVVFSLGAHFVSFKLNRTQLIGFGLVLSIMIWGTTLSMLHGSFSKNENSIILDFTIIGLGALLFGAIKHPLFPRRLVNHVVVYVLLALVYTVAVDGLILDFPPRFNFEYLGSLNREEVYSLGMSKFFGVGAICAAFAAVNSEKYYWKGANSLLMVLFIMVSLLGGGRGDSVFAIIVVFTFFAKLSAFRTMLFVVVGVLLVSLAVSDWSFLEGVVVYRRILASDGDLGERDILLRQTYDLLINEPACLLTGCGFGYFQQYYSYNYSLHPHNFLAEFLMVFGVPAAVFAAYAVCRGILIYINQTRQKDMFLLLYLYLLLTGLKSNSLTNGWLLMIANVYLASIFFSRCFRIPMAGNASFEERVGCKK